MRKNYTYNCDKCTFGSNNKTYYDRHVRTHIVYKYNCEECKYKTDSEKEFGRHTRAHKNDKNKYYCCEFMCGYSSLNMIGLTRHMLNMHGKETYKHNCEICEYGTNNKIHYDRHVNNHEKRYKCDENDCDYETNSNIDLYNHKRDDHNIIMFDYVCCDNTCDYRTNYINEYNDHLLTHPTTIQKNPLYGCNIEGCDNKYNYPGGVARHKITSHKINVNYIKCNFSNCTYKCIFPYQMKNHEAAMHNVMSNLIVCDISECTKTFNTTSALDKHKKTYHKIGVVYIFCDIPNCPFKCMYPNELVIHKKSHENRNKIVPITYKYICDICDHKTNVQRDHERHVRDHKNNKTYYCCEPICGFSVPNIISFINHMKNHHGKIIYKYNCDKCDQGFNNKKEYNKHIKSHIEKKYKCNIVGCLFETDNQREYTTHNVNHNFKKYKCNIEDCDFESDIHKQYIRHMNHHEKNHKKYYCCEMMCSYNTFTFNEIKGHVYDIHDKEIYKYNCVICDCGIDNKDEYEEHLREHNIKKYKYKCDTHMCDYETNNMKDYNDHIKECKDGHKKYYCYEMMCSFNTFNLDSMIRHVRHYHDVEMYKFSCTKCLFETNVERIYDRHVNNLDHGTNKCDFCLEFKHSKNQYKDTQGIHSVCRVCYRKATGKNSRKETIWSNYIDKKLGTNYLLGSDKSIRSLGGCQLYRPDKIYSSLHLVEIDECDEFQHSHGTDYTCDEFRILEIYHTDGIKGKIMTVIRFNPDNYKAPDGYTKKKAQERLDIMIALKRKLRQIHGQSTTHNASSLNPTTEIDKIYTYYLFYDMDNDLITQRMQHNMIYDMDDVKNLENTSPIILNNDDII